MRSKRDCLWKKRVGVDFHVWGCATDNLLRKNIKQRVFIPAQENIVAVHYLADFWIYLIQFGSNFRSQIAYEVHIQIVLDAKIVQLTARANYIADQADSCLILIALGVQV